MVQLMQKLSGHAEIAVVRAAGLSRRPRFACAENARIALVKLLRPLCKDAPVVARMVCRIRLRYRRNVAVALTLQFHACNQLGLHAELPVMLCIHTVGAVTLAAFIPVVFTLCAARRTLSIRTDVGRAVRIGIGRIEI